MSDYNPKYAARQIKLSMLRAQWWLASAQSGHYKQRKVQRGTNEKTPDGTIAFRDLSEEEKLDDCMRTALRHIELAMEFSENLAEKESEQEEQERTKR